MSVSVRFVGSGDSFGSGGRFQTCILVQGKSATVAIDFGASSLIALEQQSLDHNDIDAVVLTHLHGDHASGVPFLLLDAMLGARRSRPLTIVGPKDVEARIGQMCAALFPGMDVMRPKFPLAYRELPLEVPTPIGSMTLTAYPARHTEATNPTAVRLELDGRIVAYTGDGEWTDAMPRLGRDADLLVAECYFHEKPVPWHLNYPEIREHKAEFGAKRIVLTHMSPEMLARAGEVPEECAEDGLVIEL